MQTQQICCHLIFYVIRANILIFVSSKFGSGENAGTKPGTKVSVYIQVPRNQLQNISNWTDVYLVRNQLKILYPVEVSGEHVLITIDGATLELVHSTLLFPESFTFKVRDVNGSVESHFMGESNKDALQPFCNMQTTAGAVSGVFNLCGGLNGHYTKGQQQFNVKVYQGANSTVEHWLSFSRQHERKGNYSEVSTDNMIVSSLNNSRRVKRDTNPLYLELYVIADYDFWVRACKDNKMDSTHCLTKILGYLYPVSLLYTYEFGLYIVPIGVEIWTGGNFADIPIHKTKSLETEAGDWLINELHIWAVNEVRDKVKYDALLYLTKTSKLKSDILGLALGGNVCFGPPNAYVDTFSTDKTTVHTIAHEIGHLLAAVHVETKECKCGNYDCVMEPGGKYPTYSELIFSNCTTKAIRAKMKRSNCLSNLPLISANLHQCGNGIVEPGEECEFRLLSGCCDINCKLTGANQCTQGSCCDVPSCHFKESGLVCRSRKNDCDFEERCTGDSGFCPDDKWRLDGTECQNEGWSFCYRSECTTHNALCSKVLTDPQAKSADSFCYEHEDYRDTTTTEADKYCNIPICNFTTGGVIEKYKKWMQVKTFNVYNRRIGSTTNCQYVYQGWRIYDDLEGAIDGARCDEYSVCQNRKCVALDSLPPHCETCLGAHQGCDQTAKCYCELSDGCSAGDRETMPEDARISWQLQLGLEAKAGFLGEWITDSPPDNFKHLDGRGQDKTQKTASPILPILIPIACVALALIVGSIFMVSKKRTAAGERERQNASAQLQPESFI